MSNKNNESAAKKGVISGFILMVIEMSVGLISGSLGLLSSAFNTLMDFIASIIMFFAVRAGIKPPDEEHMYGHDKIESGAAIIEILLLFVVCVWIIYNSFLRLFSGWIYIELFWLALGTNFISIIIDIFAYYNLKKSSKERNSAAIDAGALHFLNDLLIAIIVVIGLLFYRFGIWYADSIAALVIVILIVYSSIKVVKNSVAILTDAAPRGIVDQLTSQIKEVDGVESCHHLRVRRAGSRFFVDAHVELNGEIPLSQAHTITLRIEEKILDIFPNSDILIHTEPLTQKDPFLKIHQLVTKIPEILGIHGIIVTNIGSKLLISYHIELNPEISIKLAHQIADQLEEQIKKSVANVTNITSHLEPNIRKLESYDLKVEKTENIQKEIFQISATIPEIRSFHDLKILSNKGNYNITLHCKINSIMTLKQAHEISTKIEEKIKKINEKIDHVTIHCEPED